MKAAVIEINGGGKNPHTIKGVKKMKYKVRITEVLVKVIDVEAKSYEEAEQMVHYAYKNGDIILTADDWESTEYSRD